jgi:hypothetical protein
MWTQRDIEDIILGMADIVKENRVLRKRVDELELEVAINDAHIRSYRSAEAEKEYKVLQEIQSNNLSCAIAASNGWLTSEDYIDDWRHELHKRMAAEKD